MRELSERINVNHLKASSWLITNTEGIALYKNTKEVFPKAKEVTAYDLLFYNVYEYV